MVERYRPSNPMLKKPGERGPGRPKGIPNKLGLNLKKALEGAAEKLGYVEPVWTKYRDRDDPRGRWRKGDVHPAAKVLYYRPTGRGGTEGYLMSLGIIQPHSFASLIGKLLPHHLKVEGEVEHTVRSRFEGVDLSTKSLHELMQMQREALGLTKALPKPSMIDAEAEVVVGDSSATEAFAPDRSTTQSALDAPGPEPLPIKKEEAA